ncbi:MAG: hypothetical protein F4160_04020 [Rhodospirillaceae bacterium]|nr:hypothetical protein [Rhodospirillaceae bacterium]MYH35948.1 hypothetical protein [Rhodospirillaceae bacterium]MYK13568.1 hypothetical protein [Rhodospirillaceae bacterium]
MAKNRTVRRSVAAILGTLPLAGCLATPPTSNTANTTNAYEERWTCCVHQVGVYCPNAVDVTLTADRDKSTGVITFGDIIQETHFHIDGFSRRWGWQRNAIRGYDYAFIIRPNLIGFYYDFTDLKPDETSKTSDASYTCKRH